MNLLHLQYFKVLAEKEHLLASAKAIHISPPALSSTISKLEKELGVELFDRVGRNIKLNENGQFLYHHVCRIFSEMELIEKHFSKDHTDSSNSVNVAVIAPTSWVAAFNAFIVEHPEFTVKHHTLQMGYLQNPGALDAYDLVITDASEFPHKNWEHKFIVEDPPTILLRKDHRLADREVVSMEELRNEPFVALSKLYAPRIFFDNACKQAGIIPTIVAETDYHLRTTLVEAGQGIAFSSTLGSKAVRSSLIKAIRIGPPVSPRIQTVFWKSEAELSLTAKAFRDFLVDYYRQGAGK